MTGRDGASEFPQSNEGAICLNVVRLARQRPVGRQSHISKTVLQLNSNYSACRESELTRNGTNCLDGGGVSEPTQGGRL
jgi:hypothetical protein